ncbi:hypothetical protein KBY57_06205 [Cyanobium sp. Aljojuca 7D2]|uniref:aminotransferase class I/II-fold pyridoxal phosphate-dependent enzyme n=1 Tax=Cyanobium sp. Aljojuca 7D2 TaxID=2823698 RepID=UPI0020CDA9BA|nr:beta-eliminating lyase-related protein [Cyanobium sp. Aljojuca 7D2]MCP9890650.1 hypothetical protein [Cyanobium sp. Aljojuca 7D2]
MTTDYTGNDSSQAKKDKCAYLDEHFYTTRRRKDLWNHLKDAAVTKSEALQKAVPDNLANRIRNDLLQLTSIENYWAFPGPEALAKAIALCDRGEWQELADDITILARLISTDHYRSTERMPMHTSHNIKTKEIENDICSPKANSRTFHGKPYFEILVVDSLGLEEEELLKRQHLQHAREEDSFRYGIVIVNSLEDAIIALILNYNIQACVLRYSFPSKSVNTMAAVDDYLDFTGYTWDALSRLSGTERTGVLAKILKSIRPEIDLYLISEATVEQVTDELHSDFTRCFFGTEDYQELILSILKGVYNRYETPFFNALKDYAERPSGVFHALPISRGKSISKSHWIHDYGQFYGDRMFLSETSATTGGLDSLMQPSGSLRVAQELAAKAFGAHKTLFVTNGTSTANKIVIEALTRPNDIVLMAGDCHKSHHYGAILAGIRTVILQTFQIQKYNISGAVPTNELKRNLLLLKESEELKHVRAIILTNLTFDGIAYDLENLMMECLAIKPDIIFIIDEAWFAYGVFTPLTRKRCAMSAAQNLHSRILTNEYRSNYRKWLEKTGGINKLSLDKMLEMKLLANPETTRIRVYSTQSTHKTLTALRQGSMIHIYDFSYHDEVHGFMKNAYQCHTSTSPNYQILASLDIARRQMHLEGYELIQKAFELSLIFRKAIHNSNLLVRFFTPLDHADLVPEQYRKHTGQAGLEANYWHSVNASWLNHEFALDPTRITLDISKTGISGASFKKLLMDRFDIQVNKTTFNTILIIIHIGTTRGMVTYLLEALVKIAKEIEAGKPNSLTTSRRNNLRPSDGTNCDITLPLTSNFHSHFNNIKSNLLSAGDTRLATSLAKREGAIRFINLDLDIIKDIEGGKIFVSACMVTPYPPGYPVLLPGQIVTSEAVRYLLAIEGQEVHGYDQELGLQIFSANALSP